MGDWDILGYAIACAIGQCEAAVLALGDVEDIVRRLLDEAHVSLYDAPPSLYEDLRRLRKRGYVELADDTVIIRAEHAERLRRLKRSLEENPTVAGGHTAFILDCIRSTLGEG